MPMFPKLTRRFRRFATVALALALTSASALATWSIVVVNTRTGEVAVASATCLPGSLQRLVPVVVPGIGTAAAQSAGDSSGVNRLLIFNSLQQGLTPQQILTLLQQTDPAFQSRQYGIANLTDAPVTFTGTGAGLAKPGVSGQIGDLHYAIQGNVLTCDQVVYAAEAALVGTDGDLGQRILAAMQAAHDYGGDGRCSCSQTNPTGCGCPPPTFTKSAHSAFMCVARIGDPLGTCSAIEGCANGGYYTDIDVWGQFNNPDPIHQLTGRYQTWRQSKVGVVDQVYTKLARTADSLPADGVSSLLVTIRTADLDAIPILHGGHALSVVHLSAGAPASSVGPIHDHGDGTYDFAITAGAQPGTDVWRILVDEAGHQVALQPDVTVRVDPAALLHAGYDAIGAGAGGTVPFVVDLGASEQGKSYLLLGSAAGTSPGFVFQGDLLPLNLDGFMRRTYLGQNGPSLPGSAGVLDAAGRALPAFVAAPGGLTQYVGVQLSWAVHVPGGQPNVAGPVAFDVLP